jgi:hypothetical protein
MTQIRRVGIQQQFNDITGNQVATDGSFINCSPVYEISPKYANYVIGATGTASGNSVIKVANALEKESLYVTSAVLSIIKDATSDQASGFIGIGVTIGGKTFYLLICPIITLTAQQITMTISFPFPVKIDAGSAISIISGTFTVGVRSQSAWITGFYL